MSSALTDSILKQCDNVSHVLGALAHPVRLKVLCQLAEGEQSVNELTEFCGISQSAMSQFLSRMKADGVLTYRREQQFIFYRVADPKLIQFLRAIKEIYC